MVCFSESTPTGIDYLIAKKGYAPWGIVFKKDKIFAEGGGPALVVRGDHWADFQQCPPGLRSMGVRLEPGESEWTHEREWRAPAGGTGLSFGFDKTDVVALIIGSADWPEEEMVYGYDHWQGDYDWTQVEPDWATGHERWVWCGGKLHQIGYCG